ncbi:nucleoside transporter [Meredithblackwellia eburnea MCA 4105]
MLAPLTTLTRAKHTLQHLAEEAHDDTPEELDPDEARDLVEDVYRPLMAGEERSGEDSETNADPGAGGAGHANRRGSAREEGSGLDRKARRLEVHISYLCFFILGACILLPWNSEIVAGNYFRARLDGSPLQASYTSWVSLGFMGSNLVFLYLANKSQQKAVLSTRISTSIIVMSVILVVGIVSTKIDEIEPSVFFAGLMVSTVILSACASYLQNAVVALSSRFGSRYLQGILSGQGAIGLAVAVLQFIAAYASTSPSPSNSTSPIPTPHSKLHLHLQPRAGPITPESIPPSAIRTSAFTFFLTITIFSFISFLSHVLLHNLPLYRLISTAHAESSAIHIRNGGSEAQPRVVERKVRKLGVAIAGVYVVTLAVFPSITGSVLSVNEGGTDVGVWSLGPRLSLPSLFIPLGFIVFNAGDWIGRAMPQVKALTFTDWRLLATASAARVLFIPLFLLCNVQTSLSSSASKPFINSDVVFLLLMLLFSVSNGYVSTLIMLAAIKEESLEENEVDVAATCLAFYLTSGLAVGSLISFPIRGLICKCNPFV